MRGGNKIQSLWSVMSALFSLLTCSQCLDSMRARICLGKWGFMGVSVCVCVVVWESLPCVQMRTLRSTLNTIRCRWRACLPHSFCCCQQAASRYQAKMQHLLLHPPVPSTSNLHSVESFLSNAEPGIYMEGRYRHCEREKKRILSVIIMGYIMR